MKQHRDFVLYVRNGVAINALVAFSHEVFTPATQTVPASTVEHLTLVYLDPIAAGNGIQTGEQLRSSIKVEFSVAPLTEGKVNGWKETGLLEPQTDEEIAAIGAAEELAAYQKSSGIDGDAGDWTQAGDGTGYPLQGQELSDFHLQTAQKRIAEAIEKNGGDHAFKQPIIPIAPSGRDDNGVPSIAGMGDGTITSNGTFIPSDANAPLKPFAELTHEEKQNITYPYGDIVTESGKTEEQLAAEHARQSELETPLTDAEKDELADKASAPVPSIGIGQPTE